VAKKAYYLTKLKDQDDLDEQSNFLRLILKLKPKMDPERHERYPGHDFLYDLLSLHQEIKKMKMGNPEI